jgi:toxin ParE1/3/4
MIVSPQARRDLEQAHAWIARDNPRAADRTLDRLFEAMERLEAGELTGPRVRIVGSVLARRWSVPPYRIYYRERGDEIEILRVHHQARHPIEE